jgi:hypothetical protein
VKAGHGIHGRTDKKNPWISELSDFLRTINKIDSVASLARSKQVSYRIDIVLERFGLLHLNTGCAGIIYFVT